MTDQSMEREFRERIAVLEERTRRNEHEIDSLRDNLISQNATYFSRYIKKIEELKSLFMCSTNNSTHVNNVEDEMTKHIIANGAQSQTILQPTSTFTSSQSVPKELKENPIFKMVDDKLVRKSQGKNMYDFNELNSRYQDATDYALENTPGLKDLLMKDIEDQLDDSEETTI